MQLLSHYVYGYNPAHEVDFYAINIFLFYWEVDGPSTSARICRWKKIRKFSGSIQGLRQP